MMIMALAISALFLITLILLLLVVATVELEKVFKEIAMTRRKRSDRLRI